ncbi:hypothetical protein K2Z84_09005 [Candidatus Binatia bacterium]|nr:hypothetical protein [Candidatus Binatia bacterium]
MRTKGTITLLLALGLISVLGASAPAAEDGRVGGAPLAASEPYGVALTPPIYLINFIFLYVASPDLAASMPAYRAPIPRALADCLEQNPTGCPFAEFAPLFATRQTSTAPVLRPADRTLLPLVERSRDPGRECAWPEDCRVRPEWERLAPRRAAQLPQINEPLGSKRAAQLARQLGIDDAMILSDEQYNCLLGTPPRTPDQEILFRCAQDLTNSRGSAIVPLSSYGLSLSEAGDVRSNCAPDAPCLQFNALLAGPLEEIAFSCGFLDKFTRMVAETPFLEFGVAGGPCQSGAEPACIVELSCDGAAAASGCQ